MYKDKDKTPASTCLQFESEDSFKLVGDRKRGQEIRPNPQPSGCQGSHTVNIQSCLLRVFSCVLYVQLAIVLWLNLKKFGQKIEIPNKK